jgi:hypothetical protein
MTIETETLLTNLTVGEKLAAMELLWRDLSRSPSAYASPDWHGPLLANRLANPADGAKLSLDDARRDVEERRHANRTQG